MASGHVNRANRPNTWLLRPSLRREVFPCQPTSRPHMADFVEKVRSRSLKEIRPNDDAIFGLICLPPQIDYGRLGLTAPCIMRSPASV